ncbi:RNA-directed DNA polymerase, eukaryota, reverse transcriptase zinc-binding domain protein [Tanacetum coccineum]|uniref:RNA-directed DNA polymerase, eukaryota, reverse transcriptase zinc-binding domain protein n=1 Tax=Tanacetum coccineum TaxID=301880 RepID=A0ABQ4Y721_9ASTR
MTRSLNKPYPEAFIRRIERRLMNIWEYYNHGAYPKYPNMPNDKSVDTEVQLQENLSNDESEEIGGNSRVYESKGELQTTHTDERMTVDDFNDSTDGDKLDKPDMNVSKHCNVNEVLNKMPIPVNPYPMHVNVQETVKTCVENGHKDNTYADKVISIESDDNKLEHIPTVLNENGQEFVIFDEDFMKEGSKKWEMSACGYFVGYRMTIQELRYHLYRMWSKFGLKHILNNGNGVFVFKFDNKQGCVLRVLVEANAKKGLDDNIDVLYKKKTNDERFVKKVRVEYDWKPLVCQHCGVFGHSENKSHKNLKIEKKIKENDNDAGGFAKVGNRKEKYNEGIKQYVNNFDKKKYGNQKFIYRKKINIVVDKEEVSLDKCTNQESFNTPSQTQKKMWNVGDNVIKDIKSTANKFSVLQDLEEEHLRIKLSNKEKNEVEKYLMMDLQPSVNAANKWSKEMIEYFKEKKRYVIFTQEMIDFSELAFGITKSLLDPNSKILKKIDWVMSNDEFITQFSNANVIFLPFGIFNHSLAILKIPQVMVKKNKSFRLANYITDKVDFKELVKEKWEVSTNRHKAAEDEEKLLMQKAKVKWLKEGDKNTAYFHKVLKGRINRITILSICAEDGTRFENYEVANQFVKHFEGFLRISPTTMSLTDDDNGLFKKQILLDEAELMIREVTNDEIKKTLFDIDDNKAPRPDGFTSKFFKKSWDIVKREICAAIKEFFNNGKLLGKVNATLICLVPKMLTPQKVSDFRPIACCNVIYKCISKILTNKIKLALNHIVDDNQSAFVPGRAITDNILLTQELLKGYNCANGPKRCSFKIDIQKAYDTVCWRFIEDIFRRFGFPERMAMWIMKCVASPKFIICVNCERYGYFKGVEVSSKFKITYLCFADDLIMLSHGDMSSVATLKRALDKFSSISGLYPHLRKCTMFCGSLDDDTKEVICKFFPSRKEKFLVEIFGSSLVTRKLGIETVISLVEKVRQKLMYWGSAFLLPKSVINEIEKLFKRFLWNNGDSSKGKAKLEMELLLNLRSWVGSHMRYKISDGKSINVWHDKWNIDVSLSILERSDTKWKYVLDMVWISSNNFSGTCRLPVMVVGQLGDALSVGSSGWATVKEILEFRIGRCPIPMVPFLGKREHEEMEIFIKEFRTTNELLLKEQNNVLSELKIKVNELSKVMGNVLIKNEVKGVTTRGEKMSSEATPRKEINETGINKN